MKSFEQSMKEHEAAVQDICAEVERLRTLNAELLDHIIWKDRATFAQMEIAASMLHRLEWAEASRVAKEACDAIIAAGRA